MLPLNVVDYYETVERTMGGRGPTQAFFRLFMIPGMNHCQGGAGAWAVDYLGHLEAWVEQGRAPDEMLAAHPRPDAAPRPQFGAPPPDAAQAEFTRPLYPYPLQPRLERRGDPRDARSYAPRAPARP